MEDRRTIEVLQTAVMAELTEINYYKSRDEKQAK